MPYDMERYKRFLNWYPEIGGAGRLAGRCFSRKSGGLTRMMAEPARDEDQLAEAIVASYRRAVDAVALALPDLTRVARRLAEIFAGGGRLVYVGAGASGLIAAEDAF